MWKTKSQRSKKHDLIYFEEPLVFRCNEMFYEGIDTLQSFSDLLMERSDYPEKPIRLTEALPELRKIESSSRL